jgi:hypothetical protein
MTSSTTKDSSASIGGDTAADEQRDAELPALTAKEQAKYELESQGMPEWDPDSHLG